MHVFYWQRGQLQDREHGLRFCAQWHAGCESGFKKAGMYCGAQQLGETLKREFRTQSLTELSSVDQDLAYRCPIRSLIYNTATSG